MAGTNGDSLIGKIDRFFDAVDSGIDAFDHATGRGAQLATKRQAPALAGDTVAISVPRIRVTEAIDAESGETIWVVTDTVTKEKVVCTSQAMAQRVKVAMEATV